MPKIFSAATLFVLTLFLPAPAHAKQPQQAQTPSLTAVTPLKPEDRAHLLQDTFTVVKRIADIPAPVRKQLIPDAKAVDGMANPGDSYQTTDVVGPKLLPFRRLILAADAAGYSLVYEEHGGFFYGQALSLYKLTNGTARLVWEAMVSAEARPLTFEQLRSLIRQSHSHQLVLPQTPAENKRR